MIEGSRDLVFRTLTFLINHWLLFRNFLKTFDCGSPPSWFLFEFWRGLGEWVLLVGSGGRGVGWASVTQPSVLLMLIQNDAFSRSTVVGVTAFYHYQVTRLVNYNILILLIHYVNLIKKKGQ